MSAPRVSLTIDGINELRAELRALPRELAADAQALAESHASRAAAEIRAAYQKKTGKLARGVAVVRDPSSPTKAKTRVVNRWWLSRIFEIGTEARHTDLGLNRGRMPPGNVFYPIAYRWQSRFYAALRALPATKYGLTVRGNVA